MRYRIAAFLAVCAGAGFAIGHYTDALASECTFTRHCYAYSYSYEHLALIDFVKTGGIGTVGSDGFVTQESWAVMRFDTSHTPPIPNSWIETGKIKGGWAGSQRWLRFTGVLYQNGEWYYHAAGPYNESVLSTLIYDRNADGCWEVEWLYSPPPNGWKMHTGRWCGFPVRSVFLEAGTELASNNVSVYSAGAQEVAVSDEYPCTAASYLCPGSWLPGDSAAIETVGPMSAWPYGGARGNIEWAGGGGSPEAQASASTAPTVEQATATPMKVREGKALGSKGPHAPGAKAPKGRYRATIKNAAGELVSEYVGNAYPNEAKVVSGGVE